MADVFFFFFGNTSSPKEFKRNMSIRHNVKTLREINNDNEELELEKSRFSIYVKVATSFEPH